MSACDEATLARFLIIAKAACYAADDERRLLNVLLYAAKQAVA